MKAYVAFGMKSFSTNLAYRSEVWLRTVGNFVTIFIQVAIWTAVIGNRTVDGIGLQDMITYSILNTLIFSMLLTNVYRTVDDRLRTGSIAMDLIKPLRYPLYLLADRLGNSMYQFVFTVIPTLLITWLYFGITPPYSSHHLLAFLISLAISLTISFALGYLVALIGFWFLTTFALEWTLSGLMTVFSGTFLPIWFFPPKWEAVAQALPFQYIGYIPAALYMGRIPTEDIVLTISIGLGWIIVLFGLIGLLWWKAVNRLIVQGG
jgi:ABC-2 type transport system permease protein